jgi:hypothetical protein
MHGTTLGNNTKLCAVNILDWISTFLKIQVSLPLLKCYIFDILLQPLSTTVSISEAYDSKLANVVPMLISATEKVQDKLELVFESELAGTLPYQVFITFALGCCLTTFISDVTYSHLY